MEPSSETIGAEPAGSPPTSADPPSGGQRGLSSYLKSWAASEEAAGYLETHQTRLVKTLEMTPPGGPSDRVLEMGGATCK